MKKILLIIFGTLCLSVSAQKTSKETQDKETVEFTVDSTVVLSIDDTIKALYTAISGEKGEARNWKQFKFLFKPNAKLIPAGKDKYNFSKVNYLSPEDYIKNSGKWMLKNGFHEKEISRRINKFGPIAHVFSTYESYQSKTDNIPFMRGINSIQLFNDGERWWIINIMWTNETEENIIPTAYLPLE